MFIKKKILAFLILFSGAINAAFINENFMSGFTIGFIHGCCNRTIESKFYGGFKKISWTACFLTYLAADMLHKKTFGKSGDNSEMWGRGIGQCIAESTQIDLNNDLDFKFRLRMNWKLMESGLLSIRIMDMVKQFNIKIPLVESENYPNNEDLDDAWDDDND